MKTFDILTCKCTDFSLCNCEKFHKVPFIEQVFIENQRAARKIAIISVDILIQIVFTNCLKLKNKIINKLIKYKFFE